MDDELNISVFEITGDSHCVTSSAGQKVYDRLALALRNKRNVTLSFCNVTVLTPVFLNTAIGQLYGKFDREQIRSMLKVRDFPPDDLALLKRVVDNATQYFSGLRKFPRTEGEDSKRETSN